MTRDHMIRNAYPAAPAPRASILGRAALALLEMLALGAFLLTFVGGAVIFAAMHS
jgi:hypothetical protein